MRLVRVREPSHATHDTENVVVGSIDTNLGSLDTLNGSVGENKLKSSVVNAREVATAGGLVLLGAQGKGVHVDTGVGGGGVVLVWLHGVEVGAFTLREAVLAVKLELGGDDGVVAPAVEEEGGLGEDEGAGIGDAGVELPTGGHDATVRSIRRQVTRGEHGRNRSGGIERIGVGTGVSSQIGNGVPVHSVEPARASSVNGASIVEHVVVDEGLGGEGGGVPAAEGVDGVGKGINCVGVVEGLGTEKAVEQLVALERRAVVNVAVGLDNPDELLDGVVEVELDLVGEEPTDSSPVNWSCSIRYSWGFWAMRLRSSVSKKT